MCQILLVFPLWTAQIMTNHYGSGLHVQNVPPEWAIPFWNVSSRPLLFWCLTDSATVEPRVDGLLRRGFHGQGLDVLQPARNPSVFP